jgi:hypothetical protein
MRRSVSFGVVAVVIAGCCNASCGSNSGVSSGADAASDGGPGVAGDGAAASDGGSLDGAVAADGGAPSEAGSLADGGPHVAAAACTQLAMLPMRKPTYFVDFGSGSDTADGKSQSTAWRHAPGDANAAGVAAAAKLAAGDVVLFKGGVAYKGTVTITASGSAQSPIVLEGGPQQGWGSGKAIIDGETTRPLGIALTGASYVVVEGFEVRNFDKSQSSVGIRVDGGGNDAVIGNQLHDIYYAVNPTPGGTAWEAQRGTGISVNNSPNTNVYSNVVRDCGNAGISLSADGADVQGGQTACNEVTNMNWGIVAALGDSKPGTHLSGLTIAHNYIHDFNQYYVCASWHRDGIFVFSRPDDGSLTIDNIEIADNYFEDTTSGFGSTAWIYVEFVCRNFNIHHNVLGASRSYYGIRILGDGFLVQGNHVLANNVIANQNGKGSAGMHVQQSTGLTIVNNIFYDDDVGYIIATDSMTGFSADYNLLWRVGGGTNVATLQAGPAASPGGTSYALAGLQGLGYEMHGAYADPQWSVPFANIVSDPTGFKPKPTSPAKDHGRMLTYTQDFAGTMIPQGAGPDIGAFEQ